MLDLQKEIEFFFLADFMKFWEQTLIKNFLNDSNDFLKEGL